MPDNVKKWLTLHTKYIVALLLLFIVYASTGIGCPIYKFFDVRCPTCGVTRALRGLLSGDLDLYFRMNPFAIPLLLAVAIGIHLTTAPPKLRKYGILYIIITTSSNLCWYLYRFI